nr:hypothetical protein [Paenibacillus xylanexedens]
MTKEILKKEAEEYFQTVYNECQVSAKKRVSETEIIKMMHQKFKLLSDAWYKTSGNKVLVTSFFTHSKPIVSEIKLHTNGAKTIEKGCEAGDILYLHVEMDLTGPPLLNSILYQAKVTDTTYSRYKTQERLYLNWPTFLFTSPESSKQYDVVSSPSSHDGARFLEINNHVKTNPTLNPNLRYQSYLPPNGTKTSFIDEMIDVLELNSGRMLNGTLPTASNEDKDWHDAIEFIMDYSHQKKYANMNRVVGYGKPSSNARALSLMRTDCCDQYSNYWLSNQDTTYGFPVQNTSDPDNKGMLVILGLTSDYPIEKIMTDQDS